MTRLFYSRSALFTFFYSILKPLRVDVVTWSRLKAPGCWAGTEIQAELGALIQEKAIRTVIGFGRNGFSQTNKVAFHFLKTPFLFAVCKLDSNLQKVTLWVSPQHIDNILFFDAKTLHNQFNFLHAHFF